jgi:hypothetical protein
LKFFLVQQQRLKRLENRAHCDDRRLTMKDHDLTRRLIVLFLLISSFSDCLREGALVPVTHEDVRMTFILPELGEQSLRKASPLRVSDHLAIDNLREEVPEK